MRLYTPPALPKSSFTRSHRIRHGMASWHGEAPQCNAMHIANSRMKAATAAPYSATRGATTHRAAPCRIRCERTVSLKFLWPATFELQAKTLPWDRPCLCELIIKGLTASLQLGLSQSDSLLTGIVYNFPLPIYSTPSRERSPLPTLIHSHN